MESTWNFTPVRNCENPTGYICEMAQKVVDKSQTDLDKRSCLEFRRITPDAMKEIWPILKKEPGRTTDFSYGGVLMWVDYFDYTYAIYEDTLFIKGVVEDDLSTPAFSLPVGRLSVKDSVSVLRDYCRENNLRLEFSAIPEYALDDMREAGAERIEKLADWGDYLYDAESLASLKGKKMSKKRNHVNQFVSRYPDWRVEPMNSVNCISAEEILNATESESGSSRMARSERELTRKMIGLVRDGDIAMSGMILYADGRPCAFTIGDVKGDTLFIHIEKALREFNGSYEMINHEFAAAMTEKYPEIKYINREDDAGDIGLRMAKESYHPLEILKKYNVIFF